MGKRKPGLFSVLLLGFSVVITASALTASEQGSKSANLSQPWQRDLDKSPGCEDITNSLDKSELNQSLLADKPIHGYVVSVIRNLFH